MTPIPRAGDVRERVWATLMRSREAVYPLPCHGHHPNFRGAGRAADRLATELFGSGMVAAGDIILSFPDYPLKPLRKALLERGADVVVPAKHGRGFRYLRSGRVDPARASSIAGAEREGERVSAIPPLRMALIACVALDHSGRYLTKGYGFRLPVEASTLPAATIVHPLQLIEALPQFDGRIDVYATPGKVMNLPETTI